MVISQHSLESVFRLNHGVRHSKKDRGIAGPGMSKVQGSWHAIKPLLEKVGDLTSVPAAVTVITHDVMLARS